MTKSKPKLKSKVKKEAKKEVKAVLKKAIKKAPTKGAIRVAPRAPAIRGKGGYWADLGRSVGGGLGSVADGIIGVGKTITGLGDYSIKSNSLMETAGPPRIRNTKHQSIIHHEEYLCDIKGSVDFRIQQYPINPGVTTTFPWLAPQALAYEQWKPRGIIFSFRSSSGDAVSSTNSAEGMVIMSTEYNSNLPAFSTKQEMEDHEYTTSFKPSCNGLHGIECARSLTPLSQLYIRGGSSNGSNSQNYNPLSYDLGQFYVATQGMQTDNVTVGELWVSYEIELLKPTLSTTVSNNIYQHWYYDSTLGLAPSTTYFLRNLRNANTGEITSSTNNSFSGISPGRYVLAIVHQSDASGTTLPSYAGFTFAEGSGINWTAFSVPFGSNTATNFAGGTGSANVVMTIGLEFTSVGSINYNSGYTLGGNLVSFDIHLFPIGSGLQATSRRAVDWDPFARISRRIDELARRIGVESLMDCDDEKSDSSSVLVRSPEMNDLSKSQADFAVTLLDRLGVRNSASKTALHGLP